ncbi:prostaglandin F synthase 2-like isoform 2-T2 [Dama dama]|uniref:dihydrodiol dehydrogenase 3-like isoform X2 n=1 Tax=Dama dama TaxID=30532 RepID=UPI002A3599F8|nr:dihydrodiol dehydrogenase 3-like isoform X2 [Dama dama]
MDLKSQKVKLNDGHFIPVLGFGTYAPEEVPKSEALEATKFAIEIGFRHIDSARMYQNEEQVGQAIRSKIADGAVKREDIFYTSKLWCTFLQPDLVRPALEKSLKDLQLDYVDLYIIHFPVAMKFGNLMNQNHPVLLEDPVLCAIAKKNKQTPALVALRYQIQRGIVVLIKSFNKKRIKENTQEVASHKLHAQNIAHLAGIDAHELAGRAVRGGAAVCASDVPDAHRVVHGRGRDQAAVRTEGQAGDVVRVAPQLFVEGPGRQVPQLQPLVLARGRQVFDFELSPEDMKAIDGINRNTRYNEILFGVGHPDYPFSEEY